MARLSSNQLERIRRNYKRGDPSARKLIDLLQNKVSSGAERAAKEFARRLAAYPYETRRAHNEKSKDQTIHYLVYIKNEGHHLRLDSHGNIYQITNDTKRDIGTVPPWVAPGSTLDSRDPWA